MIGKLTGRIDTLGLHDLIVDVQGVGYRVSASARTLRQMGVGQPASLLIETVVREDAIHLFGFASAAEHEWFKILTTVQGVGARVALSILSALSPVDLQMAIMAQDKARLTQADGVGPKLATRLLTELKDKVANMAVGSLSPSPSAAAAPVASHEMAGVYADAILALERLGFSRTSAWQAAAGVKHDLGEEAAVGDIIKSSLKRLTGETI